MEANGATIALLWTISGGVLVILCIMIFVTCLLIKGNYKTPRGGSTMDAYMKATKDPFMRGTGKTVTVKKANVDHTLNMDDGEYMAPRKDAPGPSLPKLPAYAPPARPCSPSASIDSHIYDDADFIQNVVGSGRAHY